MSSEKFQRLSAGQRRIKPVAIACHLTVALCATTSVHAQEANQALDTVVVTGIRKSLDTTLNLKRTATGLVDGIVSEDIGKFPDTNLAESMQRIAGVAIDRTNNGEGQRVTVRGVGPDFNMVLLNGRQMPTSFGGASGSRAFDFATLSSDAVSALEVYKTARASTPAGGIGATINVKTARPLDSKERVASIGVKANYDVSNSRVVEGLRHSKVTPEISGIYSDTFADRTIGIALSASYSKRNSGSNRALTANGWRTFAANNNSDWGAIPPKPATGADPITNRPTSGLYSTSVEMRYDTTGYSRERINGQAVLQFAPTKDLKFTLDHTVANSTFRAKEAEISAWMNYSFGPMTFTQNGGPVQSPLIQTALFPNSDHDLAFNSGVYAQKSANSSTGFNTEWKVTNDLKVDLDVHHSTSKTDPDSPYGSWAQIDLAMFTMGTTTAYYDKKLPILNLGTTKFQKERMQFTGSQFDNQLADQSVDQWQTKATYKLSAEDKLIAGLGFTKMKDRRGGYNHTNADWGGLGVQGDAASTVKVNSTSLGGMFSQVDGHNDSRLQPTFWYVDFNEAREQAIKVLMTSGVGGSAPYTRAQAEAYFAASPDYTRGQDFRTTEKSTSAYGQWDHAFDTELPSNISVGLRYESTKIDSASQVVPRVAAAWIAQNEVNLTAGEPAFGSAQGSYKFWLPNIDYDVDLASNLKLRASYGHNIGRPNFGVLVGGVTVGDNANAGGGNGNTGNPNLKPLLSKNLDASLEYYYAKSSYVAAGLFYKKVTNFIGNTVVVRTFPGINNPRAGAYAKQGEAACGANAQPLCIRNWIFTNLKGQPGVIVGTTNASGEISGRIEAQPGDPLLNFNISTPTNIKGDNIRGLELNAQHLFGNSGFGVSGNLTIVKTGLKFKLDETGEQAPLVGVGNSANLVGFYEDSAWSVRAAYNWRGKFLARSTDGAGNNPVFTAAYGQLDVGIGYKIGKNLTLQADLINLNDGYIRQFARTEEQVEGVYQTGRRFMVGARYRF